jgi:hypothetical protein
MNPAFLTLSALLLFLPVSSVSAGDSHRATSSSTHDYRTSRAIRDIQNQIDLIGLPDSGKFIREICYARKEAGRPLSGICINKMADEKRRWRWGCERMQAQEESFHGTPCLLFLSEDPQWFNRKCTRSGLIFRKEKCAMLPDGEVYLAKFGHLPGDA